MYSTFYYSICCFLIIALTQCKGNEEAVNNVNIPNFETKSPVVPIYAQGFQIDTLQGGVQKLIIKDIVSQKTIANYILIPKGVSYKTKETEISITVPLDNIGVFTTSCIGFLDALDAIENVATVENKNYIYNTSLLQRIQQGKVSEIGFSGQMNLEKLLLSPTEVILTSAFSSGLGKDFQKAGDVGIPTLFLSEWQEQHPLARAEWVKCFGVLLGKEKMADSIFDAVKENYEAISEICQTSTKKPSVLFSIPYQGVWYIPGGKSYVAQLLKDAKGTYPWAENENTGSIHLSFENVANQYQNPDVWINPETNSLSEIAAIDKRFSYFLDVPNIKVFQHNARKTINGGNDYWEQGVARPDLVLMDYGKMLHPKLFENTNFTFFQILK
jgi:iron complex transport system substrate-binding protein